MENKRLDGEFFERYLAGKEPETELKARAKATPPEDVEVLLSFVHDRQGAILCESLLNPKDKDYFDTNWRAKYDAWGRIAQALKGTGKPPRRNEYPEGLTDEGKRRFDLSIQLGLINGQTRKWIAQESTLGLWARDMNEAKLINAPKKGGGKNVLYIFDRFFAREKGAIGKALDMAENQKQNPEYDNVKKRLFPEIHID